MIEIQKLPLTGIYIAKPANHLQSDYLLIAIHGSNGSGHDFDGLENYINHSSLSYLFLNGPIHSFSNYCWYIDHQTRDRAKQLLIETLQSLEQQGYSPDHIFLLGFSQGADLVFEVGTSYAKTLAGYIAISGRIEEILPVLNGINHKGDWLVTHGTKDQTLSIEVMRNQIEQMRNSGIRIEYLEYDKGHEFESTQELPYIGSWIRGRIG